MSQYTPNFKDKRIKDRLLKIEEWALNKMHNSNFKELYSGQNGPIYKIFGSNSHPLTEYLVKHLLIRNNSTSYKIGVNSYYYMFDWNNLIYFLQEADLITNKRLFPIVKFIDRTWLFLQKDKIWNNRCYRMRLNHKFTKPKIKQIRRGSKLKIKEDRRSDCGRLIASYHNFTKEERRIIFKGYVDYDLEASAYTLIHQNLRLIMKELNKKGFGPFNWKGQYPLTYSCYEDKFCVRNQIAEDLEISVELAKQILAALFYYPQLPHYSVGKFWKHMIAEGISPVYIERLYHELKNYKFINDLCTELKDIWWIYKFWWEKTNPELDIKKQDKFMKFNNPLIEDLEDEQGIKFKFQKDSEYKFSICKFRSQMYFDLEVKVMEIAEELFGDLLNFHDGFINEEVVNIDLLTKEVYERMGLVTLWSTETL